MSDPGATLAPALRDPAERAALAARWRDGGVMRLAGVLDPGLAAELAVVLGRLPLEPRIFAQHADLSWSVDLGVPDDPDPQHPRCLLRLVAFLRRDLPDLVGAISGRRLTNPEPSTAHVWGWRKGSYIDDGRPLAPPGGVDALLGLTGLSWPEAWGGHLVWTGASGRPLTLPPGFDTLDLIDGGAFRVPVVTHRVEAITVRARLHPVAA
jgi:hypothetical protein